MGAQPGDRSGACAVCGFDPVEWNEQDSARTLAEAGALIGGWSRGAPSALRGSIDRRANLAPADIHAPVSAASDHADGVHALWHALVSIDELRRAAGDVVASQHGSVMQLNRSRGGVPKQAVLSVDVDRRGVVGDVQATRKHHGRPWQALCLWSIDVIEALVDEGHPISAGAAGENVTAAGVDWSTLRAGTIIDIGSVRCQLSAPATPCAKNRRWFTKGDIGRIDDDRHPGWSRWYASVLRTGTIAVGDPFTVEPT